MVTRRIATPKGCGRHIHAVTSPAWCYSIRGEYISDDWDSIYKGAYMHDGHNHCGWIRDSNVHCDYKVIWLCIECCVKGGLIW